MHASPWCQRIPRPMRPARSITAGLIGSRRPTKVRRAYRKFEWTKNPYLPALGGPVPGITCHTGSLQAVLKAQARKLSNSSLSPGVQNAAAVRGCLAGLRGLGLWAPIHHPMSPILPNIRPPHINDELFKACRWSAGSLSIDHQTNRSGRSLTSLVVLHR